MIFLEKLVNAAGVFYLWYLVCYTTYLFCSAAVGMTKLYKQKKRQVLYDKLKNYREIPVSILVPAHNEEVTIVESVRSLLALHYSCYEIIIIDDGSVDGTKNKVIEAFSMTRVTRQLPEKLSCMPVIDIYETNMGKIRLTLLSKEKGGKADALNAGINASVYPYFLCIDADSVLHEESLARMVCPLYEDASVIAVGGMIRAAQGILKQHNGVTLCCIPSNPVVAMQVVEYDRSFLASRILLNCFNANLIISGAFGLFRKEIVIAAGGYDTDTLGEDMGLVLKLHVFCRNNAIPYRMHYETGACCFSQVPSRLKDLKKQRQRWYLGLFQSMLKYRRLCANVRFRGVGVFSYMYYLLYELLAPFFELFGIATMFIAWGIGMLNVKYMVVLLLLYMLYGAVLSLTIFSQRVYTETGSISIAQTGKVIIMCLLESIFFRYVLSFVRIMSFIGYRRKKCEWGNIKREKCF